MTSLEFYRILSRTPEIEQFRIYGRRLIFDSKDQSIQSLKTPPNQHAWDGVEHGRKPYVEFDQPVFQQIVVLAEMHVSDVYIDDLQKPGVAGTPLLDSTADPL